jgi:exodeoxyribonuclease VII large subunit
MANLETSTLVASAAPAATVLTVWQLNNLVRDVLQATIPALQVAGEICDLSRPQSGHIYFTLKDSQAQLKVVMWRSAASRLRFSLQDGMSVVCQGSLDIYPPRGTYQLIAQQVSLQGEGTLQAALKQLHARLAAEGLFDVQAKRPIPRFPRWIALLTSPTGAAVQDFLEVLRRRWQAVRVTVVPCRVQGDGSAGDVIRGIQTIHRWSPRPDVLVLARGGGSLEDLWTFNEESVVRAIHASEIPVISGIGHDIDVTLADLVADLRALTPSEAAERVVPDQGEMLAGLVSTSARLDAVVRRRIRHLRDRLDWIARQRCFLRPQDLVHDRARRLDEYQQRMERGVRLRLRDHRGALAAMAGRLQSLSPLAVLGRGYTVTMDAESQTPIGAARDVRAGQLLETRWADGRAVSRVEQ